MAPVVTRRTLLMLLAATGFGAATPARAQLDPVHRELIQLGYNQPIQGRGPLAGYAYYYRNATNFLQRSNLTLRLAIAPVYLDGELGIGQMLGAHTDVGLGVAGGGFADSYSEIRRGKFEEDESFTGHGGKLSASVYHLFNPARQIPLYGVIRVAARESIYARADKTDRAFRLPDDDTSLQTRIGLRWGGYEPLMLPVLAMELSAWYEYTHRFDAVGYGFRDVTTGRFDRDIRTDVHTFLGRALLFYTLPEWKHTIGVSLTIGTSIGADRFSAYRLGGILPLASEVPLSLPGYYFQEISARSFALLGTSYRLPLEERNRWSLAFSHATAVVRYSRGLTQPGDWHTGITGGVAYRSPTDSWQLLLAYAYGFDALRDDDRGAHSIGFLLQFDLARTRKRIFDPTRDPIGSRGLERFLEFFR